ncbi:MAG TPA: hypothetical protein VN670_08310 [Acidobacteriaceae bacterium]|nr:hypothetical protein [Acidobacteriaceae bacterium]
MGFMGALFGGQNQNLNQDINQTGQLSTWATGVGKGAVNSAQALYQALLGGDPSKIAKLLAPQISTMAKQGNQKIQTASQFGNRSGGTNAGNQQVTDTTRANVDNMISSLTGQAATNEGNMGNDLLNAGLFSNTINATESQMRMQNWMNSILAGGITSAVNKGMSMLHI